MVFDFFGWSATFLECEYLIASIASNVRLTRVGLATYLLLWPDDGIMRKDDIRGIYDGSIFYKKEAEHQRKKELKKQRLVKRM